MPDKHTAVRSWEIQKDVTAIECGECGFVHIHPYPDQKTLSDFYATVYRMPVDNINLREKATILRERFETDTIIDLGCGHGELLEEFRNCGFDAYGVEPGEDAAKACVAKGLKVENCFIDKNPFGRKFDLVNLSFVMEHLPNPGDFITLIKREFMTDRACIAVSIPNDFNAWQSAYMDYNKVKVPYWIHYPDHLNYWNFNTFETFLNRLGFSVEYKASSFPMEMFLLMGDDYVKEPALGKAMHAKRMAFEDKLKATGQMRELFTFYERLADMNIGRTIEIIARRNGSD